MIIIFTYLDTCHFGVKLQNVDFLEILEITKLRTFEKLIFIKLLMYKFLNNQLHNRGDQRPSQSQQNER